MKSFIHKEKVALALSLNTVHAGEKVFRKTRKLKGPLSLRCYRS